MVNEDFFYKNVEVNLIERYPFNTVLNSKKTNFKNIKNNFYLFEIKENEFRKSDMLYYSRIITYRVMGILQQNMSLYSLFFSYDCINCFSRMTNLNECDNCKKKYNDTNNTNNDTNNDTIYFINVNQLFGSLEYNRLKEKFNLGFTYEIYRDQRNNMCIPMKQEIIEKALHPDRIEKILKLTNDHWMNLENYI
jgi:hypothetical protein